MSEIAHVGEFFIGNCGPPVLAVDEGKTIITEDAFCYHEDTTSGERTLSIFAVVPTKNVEILGAKIGDHLRGLFLKSSGTFSKGDRLSEFITSDSRRICSLSQKEAKNVLCASFSLTSSKKPDVKYVLSESFGFGQIVVKYMTYEEFSRTEEIDKITDFLNDLLTEYPKTFTRSNGQSFMRTKMEHGHSSWVIRVLCDLFNQSCIRECKEKKIPYFSMNKHGVILTNQSLAIFNKPLRDMLAFMNSLNLFNALNGKGITFTKEEVFAMLPSSYKN